MDSQGLVFELQWKKKHGVGNQANDIASLGIWDSADSSLDYKTFKSYLSQNLGTSEDISVAYVDSEGDELPIDSECEFEEALKFARQRSRNGRNIILKVAKEECLAKSLAEVAARNQWKPQAKHSTNLSVAEGVDKSVKQVKAGDLEDLIMYNRTLIENLDLQKKCNDDHTEPPAWFKNYMLQMKTEIVDEVNAHTRQLLSSGSPTHMIGFKHNSRISDEESSDAALGCNERDHKLLKKIEKLQKREKKLEKKLENKTKKKTQHKAQQRVSDKKRCSDVGIVLMDVMVLNDEPKCEIHINLGKKFTKIWEIMNNGTLSWTDKTELRLAWGTLGLEPQESVVKCPLLEPGEKGQIAVNFRAPDFPGMFESYWHFYHMGERFGHWIGCAVFVEGTLISDDISNIAVDLTMKCKSDSDSDKLSMSSDSDDDKFVVVPMPPCFIRDIPITRDVQDGNQTLNAPEVDGAESSIPLPPPNKVPNIPDPDIPVPKIPVPKIPDPVVPVPKIPDPVVPVPNAGTAPAQITEALVNGTTPNNSVHILPETIVNGAINVATSAFSTAKAVLSNLRSMPSVGNEWQAPRQETSTSDCQKLLVDMGFKNLNLNLLLLQRYNNDMAKVVAELLQSQLLEFD